MLKEIIEKLFPRHDPSRWPHFVGQLGTGVGDEKSVTDDELAGIAKPLSVGEPPDPNGISKLAVKVDITETPGMFRSVMQKCLDEGSFQKFGSGTAWYFCQTQGNHPETRRHIDQCLMYTAGKVLEKIIISRLLRHTVDVNALSRNQFGFRKVKSTEHSIMLVTKTTEIVHLLNRRGIRYCAVVTLDVRNTFNSASLAAIADALLRLRIHTWVSVQDSRKLHPESSTYLLTLRHRGGSEVISHNLRSPTMLYPGPDVMEWHMYDEFLRQKCSVEVEIVGLADDISLQVYGAWIEEVESNAALSITVVVKWMSPRKLKQHCVKHLGVMIVDKSTFGSYVDNACKRASTAIVALSRMMSNSSVVYTSTCKHLASVASPILGCGGPAWRAALSR
ncbi:uncharacterized protein LOC134292132 [Aedes albopictus]|uniref:Reverse transcriptase domain-containing protein n=1 Tax=Aedes albopictus TaxID=7160 RepID=A0ABM1ZBW5_AEDAL